MSSFYAELVVAGRTYPLRQCQFEFTQATGQRGRVQAKVRHGLLHLTLDVPTDDQLLAWAHATHKTLDGHITFFDTARRAAARETVSFAAGQCVSYHETFEAGNGAAGAYVCQLIITTEGLVLTPGGPATPFVAPAPRAYAAPAVAAAVASAVPRLSLITGHPPFLIKGARKDRPALDRTEFVRQLTNQEDGLNRLTVHEFLANRDQYASLRASKGSGRAPAGDVAQQEARKEALQDKIDELRLANEDLTEKEARLQAQQWLDTQAALHNPDQVAGGHADIVADLGEARVNSSIGAQWPARIEGIDSQVRKQAATMTLAQQQRTFLNVKLPYA